MLRSCRRMCDLLDEPSALVSGSKKSQQGDSLGMQLGKLAKLIIMFVISLIGHWGSLQQYRRNEEPYCRSDVIVACEM